MTYLSMISIFTDLERAISWLVFGELPRNRKNEGR